MAQTIHEIKDKILSTQNMSKITKAMQMVSAAKLTKSEVKQKSYQYYLESLESMMSNMANTSAFQSHSYFNPKSQTKCTGYLVVTSDRGLAGGYNNNVLKLLQQETSQLNRDEYKIYLMGSKGFEYARRTKIEVENKFIFVSDDAVYKDIEPIVTQIMDDYTKGLINKIVIIYSDYLSKIFQEPTTKSLLPLASKDKLKEAKTSYTFEPNEEEVVDVILQKYIEGIIYGVFLTAKLSEHAARMNAMQNATDNAIEIIKDSELVYNRARQAAITQEINEIVGGASALD